MGKINLKLKLTSLDEKLNLNLVGLKNKNKITYKENNVNVTILIFDNKIEMNRTCNEYKINLVFEKNKMTISTYQVFGMPKVFDLETNTNKLIIKDNSIEVNYNLEGNDFKYILIWEVIHEKDFETRN